MGRYLQQITGLAACGSEAPLSVCPRLVLLRCVQHDLSTAGLIPAVKDDALARLTCEGTGLVLLP